MVHKKSSFYTIMADKVVAFDKVLHEIEEWNGDNIEDIEDQVNTFLALHRDLDDDDIDNSVNLLAEVMGPLGGGSWPHDISNAYCWLCIDTLGNKVFVEHNEVNWFPSIILTEANCKLLSDAEIRHRYKEWFEGNDEENLKDFPNPKDATVETIKDLAQREMFY